MKDNLTLLTAVPSTSLVKTFSGSDKAEQPFAIGEDFKVTKEPVSDLSSLAELLHRLESKPTQTIISEALGCFDRPSVTL